MFDWLYVLLGKMLAFFTSFTGSYVWALLLYALIFKLLFAIFSVNQQKKQIKMAQLTPKIELIKAKYRGRTDQVTMRKQQEEIMELQQKEGYSPLSGCLPLLLQLPIIMLLYAVIRNPISYIAITTPELDSYNDAVKDGETYEGEDRFLYIYGEAVEKKDEDGNVVKDENGNPILEKIKTDKQIDKEAIVAKLKTVYTNSDGSEPKEEIDLLNNIYKKIEEADDREAAIKTLEEYGISYESIPDFTLFGVNLADKPSFKDFSILVLIPFIAAALTWLSMFLSRKWNGNQLQQLQAQGQDAQAKSSMIMMDLMMPAMTLWLAFSFSGMLGIYWIYQSALGILQTFILSRVMPMPRYTEEELKEMRKAQKAAEKAQKQALKENPRYRSLHYIDDDDYEELPEVKSSDDKKDKGGKGGSGIDITDIKD